MRSCLLLILLVSVSVVANAMVDTAQFKHNVTARCIAFVLADKKAPNPAYDPYTGSNKAELLKHYNSKALKNKIEEIYGFEIDIKDSGRAKLSSEAFIMNAINVVASDDRKYRRDLPDYIPFDSKLQEERRQFLAAFSEAKPAPVVGEVTMATTQTNTAAAAKIEVKNDTNLAVGSQWRSIDYLLLLLPFVLTGAVALYYQSRINKLKDNINVPSETKDEDTAIKLIDERISQLETTVTRRLNDFEYKLKGKSIEVKTPEEPKTSPVKIVESQKLINEKPAKIVQPEPKKEKVLKTLYARYADQNGFNKSNLEKDPDNQSVFVISVLSDTEALYEINEESAIQKLAISNFQNYFIDTCIFNSLPTHANQKIRTPKKGKLTLKSNTWEITSKAEIEVV